MPAGAGRHRAGEEEAEGKAPERRVGGASQLMASAGQATVDLSFSAQLRITAQDHARLVGFRSMPTIASSQLDPPKSWDEFEDLCADLFALEWGDKNAVRHGRQGQSQNGVDFYGRNGKGNFAGVQCKGKRRWPPAKLTEKEIDGEVAKALRFRPPLKEFTIATSSDDDTRLQAHVRAITSRHKTKGLFSVHVLGWNELARRLTRYPSLIEKHYGYTALTSIRNEIASVPARTVDLVARGIATLHLETKLFEPSPDGLNRFFLVRVRLPLWAENAKWKHSAPS